MKVVYFLTLMLALFVVGKAQTFTVYPSLVVNTTLDARNTANVYIHFPNSTAQPITLAWEVTNSNYPQGWLMQVCDNNLCYNLPHPLETMNPVVQGDSGFLKMICFPLEIAGTGTITFHVYDVNSPTSSVNVTYNFEATSTVGFTTGPTEENVNIFPNPAQDYLNIRSLNGQLEKGSVKLYDLKGQLLLDQPVKAGQGNSIDVQTITPGMYLLRYESKSGILTKKVVISH